jgi:hypothetical protein
MPTSAGRLSFLHKSLAVLICAAAFAISCSSLKVSTNFPGFDPAEMIHFSSDGVNFAVKAITSRQNYQDIFHDYLPEIGLAAIWIQVQNARSGKITLTPEKWTLQVGKRNMKQRNASAILKHYYRSRNIRIYTINTDLRARQNLETLMLPSGPIASSMKCSGFVFFRIDPTRALSWNIGAIMTNKDIYLDNGNRITVRLPLAYANP